SHPARGFRRGFGGLVADSGHIHRAASMLKILMLRLCDIAKLVHLISGFTLGYDRRLPTPPISEVSTPLA
ncbi:hypothetical protein, partial [Mesorhizobium sp.]|uniref:hypothetical protein n=1 Tax=Mesorhizobium sp. TaxID=1871066 RepID=UPI0025D56DFC